MAADKIKSGWLGRMFNREGGSEAKVDVDESKVLESIRKSELFSDLGPAQMDAMLSRMEAVSMNAGDAVIREGEDGDYYYVLVKGRVSVLKGTGGDEKEVAQLDVLSCFGEEALISNAKRNATIRMLEPGVIIRLSKADFNEYIKEPMLDWVNPMDALQEVRNGKKWLDVRDVAEFSRGHLHRAVSLPLSTLRTMIGSLEKDTPYVCYCQNGRQSSTAAFLLSQFGYNVRVLRGGLDRL